MMEDRHRKKQLNMQEKEKNQLDQYSNMQEVVVSIAK